MFFVRVDVLQTKGFQAQDIAFKDEGIAYAWEVLRAEHKGIFMVIGYKTHGCHE